MIFTNFPEAEQEALEKQERDRKAERAYAYNEGLEKGTKDGRAEGMEKGQQEERQKVVENMLKSRLDLSLISKVTGLSETEINKLKNSF